MIRGECFRGLRRLGDDEVAGVGRLGVGCVIGRWVVRDLGAAIGCRSHGAIGSAAGRPRVPNCGIWSPGRARPCNGCPLCGVVLGESEAIVGNESERRLAGEDRALIDQLYVPHATPRRFGRPAKTPKTSFRRPSFAPCSPRAHWEPWRTRLHICAGVVAPLLDTDLSALRPRRQCQGRAPSA